VLSRFAIQWAFRIEEEIVLPSRVSGAVMAKSGDFSSLEEMKTGAEISAPVSH
jgi:hypothetical protein